MLVFLVPFVMIFVRVMMLMMLVMFVLSTVVRIMRYMFGVSFFPLPFLVFHPLSLRTVLLRLHLLRYPIPRSVYLFDWRAHFFTEID